MSRREDAHRDEAFTAVITAALDSIYVPATNPHGSLADLRNRIAARTDADETVLARRARPRLTRPCFLATGAIVTAAAACYVMFPSGGQEAFSISLGDLVPAAQTSSTPQVVHTSLNGTRVIGWVATVSNGPGRMTPKKFSYRPNKAEPATFSAVLPPSGWQHTESCRWTVQFANGVEEIYTTQPTKSVDIHLSVPSLAGLTITVTPARPGRGPAKCAMVQLATGGGAVTPTALTSASPTATPPATRPSATSSPTRSAAAGSSASASPSPGPPASPSPRPSTSASGAAGSPAGTPGRPD